MMSKLFTSTLLLIFCFVIAAAQEPTAVTSQPSKDGFEYRLLATNRDHNGKRDEGGGKRRLPLPRVASGETVLEVLRRSS